MSATTTTAPTTTSTCHPKLYDIPVKDAACAIPIADPNSSLMSKCCGTASVLSYSHCDYYCLAEGQSVGDLAECLIKGGSDPGDFWCNTSANATATATAEPTGKSVGTVVATATSGKGTGTGSGTSGASASSTSTSGADGVRVGKMAMGVVMMVIFGSLAGVVG